VQTHEEAEAKLPAQPAAPEPEEAKVPEPPRDVPAGPDGDEALQG
jgi:hypothetical protein